LYVFLNSKKQRLIDSVLIVLICGNYAFIDNGKGWTLFSFERERDLSYPSFTLMSTTLTHYGKAATIILLKISY